jgi:hypothetical protein
MLRAVLPREHTAVPPAGMGKSPHRAPFLFPSFGDPLALPHGQAHAQGERPAEEPCAHSRTIGSPRRIAYVVEYGVEQALDAIVKVDHGRTSSMRL